MKLPKFITRRQNQRMLITKLKAVMNPEEVEPFLDACTDFAKMGWTPKQITELIEAIAESRIVAFGFGQTHIIGTTDRSKL